MPPSSKKPSERRRYHATTLSKIMPSLTRKVTSKQGMLFGAMINDWTSIMGSYYSQIMVPVRISFPPKKKTGGTLWIKTTSAASMEIQQLQQQLIERVNGFFGYGAIEKFRIIHDSSALRHRQETVKKSTKHLSPKQQQDIQQQTTSTLKDIEDPELKAILERLGKAVFTKNKT